MDIIFKGRHTSVTERFRRHAAAKLARLEKLDHRTIRTDVEICSERNPRRADHSERVELTIRSRGPAIRAEAAAADQYVAFDLAFAKLEARLRRASERRKERRSDESIRSAEVLAAVTAPGQAESAAALDEAGVREDTVALNGGRSRGGRTNRQQATVPLPALPDETEEVTGPDEADESFSGLVPIQMEGDGPLVVREKFHFSRPMTIDQALLQMELVGHDFYAFHDSGCGKFSVVYRRCGYDYGVIRLVEE